MSPTSAAAAFPAGDPDLSVDVVSYGPDIPDESSLRLLGSVEGRRALVLGVGNGRIPMVLAKQGAHVIVLDPDHGALEDARDLADAEDQRLELHQGDMADLAFVRADTVDVALSVYELGRFGDLDRVLRQVHRVLRPGAHLVCSLPHPAFLMLDAEGDDPFRLVQAYADRTGRETDGTVVFPRTVTEVFFSLHRANFRIDTVLEPVPEPGADRGPFWSEAMTMVPATLIVRGRKEGI
jgi:SAM-dependent methyltransferase